MLAGKRKRVRSDGERARIAAVVVAVIFVLTLYALGALGQYIRTHYMPDIATTATKAVCSGPFDVKASLSGFQSVGTG